MRAKTEAEHTFFLVSDAMLGYKIELEYCNIKWIIWCIKIIIHPYIAYIYLFIHLSLNYNRHVYHLQKHLSVHRHFPELHTAAHSHTHISPSLPPFHPSNPSWTEWCGAEGRIQSTAVLYCTVLFHYCKFQTQPISLLWQIFDEWPIGHSSNICNYSEIGCVWNLQ